MSGLLVATALAALAPAAAASPPGTPDLSFGSCGFSQFNALDDRGVVLAPTDPGVAVDPDGRIIVAGMGITRLLADGTVDVSFGGSGSVPIEPGPVAVQLGGRVVTAGTVLSGHLPDGRPDPAFTSSPLPGEVRAFAVQSDGRILIATESDVTRFLADGSPDPAFTGTGVLATVDGVDAVAGIAPQTDGKIVLALRTTTGYARVARLHADGSPDTGFGTGGVATVARAAGRLYPRSVAVDRSGRIVLAGTSATPDLSRTMTPAVVRFLPGGTPDPSYGEGGIRLLVEGVAEGVFGMALATDGSVVLGVTGPEPGVVRLRDEGSLDPTFGGDGTPTVPVPAGVEASASDLAATPDGGWVAVGVAWGPGSGNSRAWVARFSGPGGPAVQATPSTCTRSAALEPTSASIEGVAVGQSSPPRSLALRNTGTAPLPVTKVALGGFTHQGLDQWSIVGEDCVGRTLPVGASCRVSVSFRPNSTAGSWLYLQVWHGGRMGSESAYLAGRAHSPRPARGWGWNGLGQVGPGAADVAGPTTLDLPGTVAVAAGSYHSLALREDGTVWAWGWNGVGQLGDGTTVDRARPVQVGGLTDVAAVAAGAAHSVAIRRDGTVWAWGWNAYGQLGDGTATDRWAPVPVAGAPTAAHVSAGWAHTLAVSSDGTAWAWGWNGHGQLGDGSTTTRLRPVPVLGLTEVRQVAAGAFHSLAVTWPGTAWGWGLNHVGQVGDGTTVDRHRPVAVIGQHVVHVSAGAYHSLAQGGPYALGWGWNALGQVGDGTTIDRHRPVWVAAHTPVGSITAGAYHNLYRAPDDQLYGWGWNDYGQVAVGAGPVAWAPQALATRAAGMAGGALHSLSA